MGIPSRGNRMDQGREAWMHVRHVVVTVVWPATARRAFHLSISSQTYTPNLRVLGTYPMQYKGRNSGLEFRRPIVPVSDTQCHLGLVTVPAFASITSSAK